MSELRGRVGEALDAVKASHLKAQVRTVVTKRGAMRFRHQACTTAQERYPAVTGRLLVGVLRPVSSSYVRSASLRCKARCF